MELVTYTPFPVLPFQNQDPQGRRRGVMIMRAVMRFDLQNPGAPLLPVPDQGALNFQDRYRDSHTNSSLRWASDLVPFKPNADIYIDATAYAPANQPARTWDVAMRIGTLAHTLRVNGPRWWQRKRWRGWRLSEAEPATSVPLTYEHAYGGRYLTDPKDPATVTAFPANPVGRGYFDVKAGVVGERIAAPQIEDPAMPISDPTTPYTPMGWGATAPVWQPRKNKAGTYDQKWLDAGGHRLPDDYQEAFNNCAHETLQYAGYPLGDEEVLLQGLSPHGDLHARLPNYRALLLARYHGGAMLPQGLALDTIFFDLSASNPADYRVYLTWRGFYPVNQPLRRLESRLAILPSCTQTEANHGCA